MTQLLSKKEPWDSDQTILEETTTDSHMPEDIEVEVSIFAKKIHDLVVSFVAIMKNQHYRNLPAIILTFINNYQAKWITVERKFK